LFTASELRGYFADLLDIEDLRGLDVFHNRFAPDPRWNPTSLAIDDQFSDELERLEAVYATRAGFMERASHLLLTARGRNWRERIRSQRTAAVLRRDRRSDAFPF
jgi:hypothetical protein